MKNNHATASFGNKLIGTLEIEEIYKPNKKEIVGKVFGTTDSKHPCVQNFLELHENMVSQENMDASKLYNVLLKC
ncbi:hypothetical protein [Methanoplanus endosymbiosus]|uniref:hypothetical protein n=1 Tax=Methanoplanus endosymbiosus TaxID=33865 RepID=UPI003561C488